MESCDTDNVRHALGVLADGELERMLDDSWTGRGECSGERLERLSGELRVDAGRAREIFVSLAAFVRLCVWNGDAPAPLDTDGRLSALVVGRLPSWQEASFVRAPGLPKLIVATATAAMAMTSEDHCDGAAAFLSLEIEGVSEDIATVASSDTVDVAMDRQQVGMVVTELREVAAKLKGLASA